MNRYVYFITHDYDYEGHNIVSVESSAVKAVKLAEKNKGGDYTTVMRYTIGSGSIGSKMIAQWKRVICSYKRLEND